MECLIQEAYRMLDHDPLQDQVILPGATVSVTIPLDNDPSQNAAVCKEYYDVAINDVDDSHYSFLVHVLKEIQQWPSIKTARWSNDNDGVVVSIETTATQSTLELDVRIPECSVMDAIIAIDIMVGMISHCLLQRTSLVQAIMDVHYPSLYMERKELTNYMPTSNQVH